MTRSNSCGFICLTARRINDRVRIRHVGVHYQRLRARLGDFGLRMLERKVVAADEPNVVST